MNDSHSEDDGVIGYHAATVHPPMTQPSAAALFPSSSIRPSVLPVIGCKRYKSLFDRLFAAYSLPRFTAFIFVSTAEGLRLNCARRAASIVSAWMPSRCASTPT